MNSAPNSADATDFDFIIVGSGAGGAPLAGRLALAGKKVLVIEAGADHARVPNTVTGADTRPAETAAENAARLAALEVSLVPSLHGVSTEYPELSWQFFCQHYKTSPSPQDPKWHHSADPALDGVFYPRAAALGGCTVHNAMITIAGPDGDWDDLAGFLDDESWSGRAMRRHFEKLERNEYLPPRDPIPTRWFHRAWHSFRWLVNVPWLGLREPDYDGGHHGFDGWLHTSVADVSLALGDKPLVKTVSAALLRCIGARLDNGWTLTRNILKGRASEALDPNHSRTQAESPEGVILVPISVCGKKTTIHQNAETPFVQRGRRSSPREFLLEVQAHPEHGKNLTIWTECFVTRVIFEDDMAAKTPRAVGVEFYREGGIYRAHQKPKTPATKPQPVRVKKGGEVILCGGSFNTPQLLMLSGIGDEKELTKLGIPVRVDAPSVGKNLQDRLEVTVITEMKKDFALLKHATFSPQAPAATTDPFLREWRAEGTGLYTSNGAVIGILKRSHPHADQPDLFIFGVPLPFRGYEVGYSGIGNIHNKFSWVILKSHTRNHGGTVALRSTDPLATPLINFRSFNDAADDGRPRLHDDPDLAALVAGVDFVRGIADSPLLWWKKSGAKAKGEVHPDRSVVAVGNEAQIKDWILREAWGHHACGTCRMGPDDDKDAVLDRHFKVRKVEGLRVVDASIFPKIPGMFIVTNIYMASEKAAEVILADADLAPRYPIELRKVEAAALDERRKHVAQANASGQPGPIDATGEWPEDVTGLAISGGGIRSATLNLGVLQALARARVLRGVDFLSTVSGGGYVGSFLGRIFDRLRTDEFLGDPKKSQPAPARVESELIDPESRSVAWLRKHGNYISPTGEGDARLNLATFLRNLLSVHFVVGTFVFVLFGIANALRYGVFESATAGAGFVIDKASLPIGHLLHAALGPFFSPWFVLCELFVLIFCLPQAVGYWLASQEHPRRYQATTLTLLFLVGSLLLLVGVTSGLHAEPLILGLALFSSLLHVEWAWKKARDREAAVGTGGPEAQRRRTRNILTYDLSLSLAFAGGALGFAFIDTIAHGLQQWLIAENRSYAEAFAKLGTLAASAFSAARWLANFFASDKRSSSSCCCCSHEGGSTFYRARPQSFFSRILKSHLIPGLLAVVLLIVPLVFYAFAAHAVFDGGAQLWLGIAVTALALLLSLVLASQDALGFVNRSSLASTYGARLARAYLGASNPLRHRPTGSDVTEVIGGDNVAAIPDYRPHEAGGPIHILNVTVNQTVDFTSQRGNRDRKGENMAVSCLGLSVGERYHALWPQPSKNAAGAAKHPVRLEAIDTIDGEHPLKDARGDSATGAEMLSLRQWMAISGAAVSPGSGPTTKLGTALLFGLANLRLGHWWDSSIFDAARAGFPRLSFTRRLLYLVPRLFRTQALLLYEWIARFPGPWERHWFISDGGFFENLAAYELIRRRVPRIIVCDGTGDPRYEFDELANLIRKAKIDFDACIEPFTADDIAKYAVPSAVGTIEELRPKKDAEGNILEASKKHAALFWVRYECKQRCGDTRPRGSVLLYLKATLTGDEAPDIRHYATINPDFPHQATGDQFFDEPQWESYRALGEHIGRPVFADARDPKWFWKIPVEPAPGDPGYIVPPRLPKP